MAQELLLILFQGLHVLREDPVAPGVIGGRF